MLTMKDDGVTLKRVASQFVADDPNPVNLFNVKIDRINRTSWESENREVKLKVIVDDYTMVLLDRITSFIDSFVETKGYAKWFYQNGNIVVFCDAWTAENIFIALRFITRTIDGDNEKDNQFVDELEKLYKGCKELGDFKNAILKAAIMA